MTQQNKTKLRVGVTVGDLNGIGMEVIMKTFQDARMAHDIVPIIYGSTKSASFHRKALNVRDFNFNSIKDAADAANKKVNLVNCWDEELEITLGSPSSAAGRMALLSLETATADLADGKVDVIVTAPIDKHTIQSEEFNFPGHTEFLASLSNVNEALMLMVSENMRVGVVTGHIPIKEVATTVTKEKIEHKILQMHTSLVRDFGIRKPKIAVLGLNPHAGDRGTIGEEDKNIVVPAINQAKEDGILALGPYPADGFFGSSNFKNFDGILAMYHDQGLTPFKALSFGNGVNYTAGLPIVRTSPDHGTGYQIAGKNQANAASFRTAVFLACDIYKRRKEHRELNANKLKPQKERK